MKKNAHIFFLAPSFLALAGGCSSKSVPISKDPTGENQHVTPLTDCSISKHGPSMLQVAAPNGVSFCIDQTEVTQGQFLEFVNDVHDDKSLQDPRCVVVNKSYGSNASDEHCPGSLSKKDSEPMTCVDWCDAAAYCKWAGKRLCGKIGGGSLEAPLVQDGEDHHDDLSQGADASLSQWYAACSQGGKTTFSYGNEENDAICSSVSMPSCKGNLAPFDKIIDLGGSVDEWEDLCGQDGCAVRGGRAVTGGSHTCDALPGEFSIAGHSAGTDLIGFRCCADLWGGSW